MIGIKIMKELKFIFEGKAQLLIISKSLLISFAGVWVSCAEVPSANSIGSKAFCKNIMYIKNNKGTKVESWRTEALIFSYCFLSWNSSYEEGPYHIETSLLI